MARYMTVILFKGGLRRFSEVFQYTGLRNFLFFLSYFCLVILEKTDTGPRFFLNYYSVSHTVFRPGPFENSKTIFKCMLRLFSDDAKPQAEAYMGDKAVSTNYVSLQKKQTKPNLARSGFCITSLG